MLGLGLDLTLRARFDLTLDDFMRHMWEAHGVPEIPYVVEDLERELGVYTRDAAFANDFFDRFGNSRRQTTQPANWICC